MGSRPCRIVAKTKLLWLGEVTCMHKQTDANAIAIKQTVLHVPAMRGKGGPAPQKPWEAAEGLEWELPSPAPFHTFENPPKLDATSTRVIG